MPFDGISGFPQSRFAWAGEFGRKLVSGWLTFFEESPAQENLGRSVALARESIVVLDLLSDKLDGGRNWTKGRYRSKGKFCLVGAIRHIRARRQVRDAVYVYLGDAIKDVGCVGGEFLEQQTPIVEFNDSRSSFADISNVIARARQRAQAVADSAA
jgi:hypothetical protein